MRLNQMLLPAWKKAQERQASEDAGKLRLQPLTQMAGAERNSPMSSIYTYNDYLRDLLKDAPCILAYDTAADYLGLSNGSSFHEAAHIYVQSPLHIDGTREHIVPSFEAVEHENRLGLLCTTVNQTINDLLRADGDNQVIQESLADVYFSNGESFDSLQIEEELLPRFEKYKIWAMEYYDEA